jgi:hypothetical protein
MDNRPVSGHLDLAYRLCQVESAYQLERCRLKGWLDLSQAHLQVLAEQRRDCPNMPGILGSALDSNSGLEPPPRDGAAAAPRPNLAN